VGAFECTTPCHFVVPKARSALPNVVRGEIFAEWQRQGSGEECTTLIRPVGAPSPFIMGEGKESGRSVWKKRLKSQDFSTKVEMTRWGVFGMVARNREYVPYSFGRTLPRG
jgi:hypothetical protein